MATEATNFNEAVQLIVPDSNRLNKIINGTSTEEVQLDDGSYVPSVRKSMVENLKFLPPIDWVVGEDETVFNQLRLFTDGSWWYAENARPSTPVPMGVSPYNDSNWVLSPLNTHIIDTLVDIQGEWVVGEDVKKGQLWTYQGSEWRSKTGVSIEPSDGDDWRKNINQLDLAETLEKSLGINARIWPKDRNLITGDVIPSAQETNDGLPITHVIVDGNAYVMSPISSGIVADLTDSGATIGGVSVGFIKPPSRKDIFVSDFGSDIDALISAIEFAKQFGHQKVICDVAAISVSPPSRSPSGFSNYMTWNYVYKIDGFNGEIDLSPCEFTIEPDLINNTRITVFVATNCGGLITLPKVNGQLSQHNMPTGYIDDCFFRVGAGCKNLTIDNRKLIKDYPGHGVLVRHYAQDNGDASLADGVPEHIRIIGKGGIIGSWLSGVTTVTGYDVYVEVVSDLNGNIASKNGAFIADVGHGVHFEAVTNGSQDPYVKRHHANLCNTRYNRLNGLMFHTAINDYKSTFNYSAYNDQHGVEYNAYCDGLVDFGNVFEHNKGHGIYSSLSTASWLGSETKDVSASINSKSSFNDGLGIYDNSHPATVVYSGFIKRCKAGGYFSANGTSRNRNSLTQLTISDCCEGVSGYGCTLTTELVSDVKILNSDPIKYLMTPFYLKSGAVRAVFGGGVVIPSDSPSATDFDAEFDQPSRMPIMDGSIRLNGDLCSINARCMRVKPKGNGTWNIPTGFAVVSVSNKSGQTPAYRLSDECNDDRLGAFFELRNAGVSANIALINGTINSNASFQMSSGSVYRVYYESLGNVTISLVS